MRTTNPKLQPMILQKTLELLQEKEPYEIGMRDIAEKCGVTATTIYRYYKAKEDLFRKISLDNLERLNFFLEKRVSKIDNP